MVCIPCYYNSNDTNLIERHLYVCTHNARDCRCGTVGVGVFKSLSKLFSTTPSSSSEGEAPARVRVQEIGHVGGHSYAANVLDFPSGDMYGSVLPSNVEAFARALSVNTTPLGADMDASASSSSSGATTRSVEDEKLLLSHWRGRLGMSTEEQVAFAADLTSRLNNVDGVTTSPDTMTAVLSPIRRTRKSMIPLVFETYEGERIALDAEEGQTVMEVAKKAGVPSIEGTCGGKLEVRFRDHFFRSSFILSFLSHYIFREYDTFLLTAGVLHFPQ